MSEANEMLLFIGEHVGANPASFLKIRALFEDFEVISCTPYHPHQLRALEYFQALELVRSACEKVIAK